MCNLAELHLVKNSVTFQSHTTPPPPQEINVIFQTQAYNY